MGNNILLDNFLLVFLASIGILQIAASCAGLRGLLFLRQPIMSSLFGAVLVIGTFVWFYLSGDRIHVPPPAEGSQRFGLTVAGWAGAIFVTLLISSVVNWRMAHSEGQGLGLEALKGTTYLRLIVGSLKRMVKR